MNPKNEAPHKGGATCDKLAGGARYLSNLDVERAQFLIAAHAIRPELAVMVAALAFGGAYHG
jgi:hypothetical protein